MSTVARVKFTNYTASVTRALDLIGAGPGLPQEGLIIIKPNLTNASPPPVTTNVAAVEAVYRYCRKYTTAEIAVGEGCGSGITQDTFDANGYTDLAQKYNLPLIDFNRHQSVLLKNNDALQLREFHMPGILLEAFIISVPVLKDHSFTRTTIAMKNMFGIAPAPFYKGGWNKSKLHSPSTDKSVVDICTYKKPDLSVVDASIALTGMHLSGTEKHIGLILAGFDPVAVDTVGSRLLGHDPSKLEYLTLANGKIGSMENIEILAG
ncbi:MAG: DUF362 domain-containing protein [Planctomycetota bacterium]